MPTGATVNLKLLIQATNTASKEVVKLQGQINRLSQAAVDLGKKSAQGGKQGSAGVDKLTSSTERFTEAMAKGKRATEGFGSAGLTLLGIAASLGTATFFPVKSAADFEQAMSGVLAVTDNAQESFEGLKATASELGRTTKFTAREAAEGMQYLGQAGFDAGEVMAGIGPSLQLAIAAAVDLGQAANIATNVLSGMRLPVSDLQTVVDVLAKTAAVSNAELLDMADALSYAGPIAASAGVNIQELASVVGVLGNAGIQGSRAGTALRGALFALTGPSAAASKRLEELGVHIELSADGSIDLINAFHQLADAGIQAADAQEIFGRYAATGVLAITSQIDSLDGMVAANYAAAGAAQKMADIMKDNLKGAFTEMLSAVDGLKRAFGDPLLGPLRVVVETITSLLGVVTSLAEKFPITTKLFGVMTLAATALAASLGFVALGIGSINTAMGILAKPAIAGILSKLGVAFFGLSTKVGTTAYAFRALKLDMSLTTGIFAKVAVAAKALWVTMLANPIIPIIAAVGALILILSELEAREKRLIIETRTAAAANEALRASYVQQVAALKEMEKGSEKATATTKNMREQLLNTADSNKELSIEARTAANSIDEFTGEVTDGGIALEAFIEKTKELAQSNMSESLSRVNDQLARQQNKLFDLVGIWHQMKVAADVWFANLIPGFRTVEDVINDNIEATEKLKKEVELANRATLNMLKTQGEFDPSMTNAEVVEFFRVIKGESKETAEALAATNELMREEALVTKDIVGTVKALSLDELRADIAESTDKVNELGDAFDKAASASQEASEALSALPERARKNATEELALVEETQKARTEAANALKAEEEENSQKIIALKTKLRNETGKLYDAELADLKNQKELGFIVEWEYANQVADLNAKRAVDEKKNLIELQTAIAKIRADSVTKLPDADKAAKEIERANNRIADKEREAADARIKHANTVNQAIVDSRRQATSIMIGLMEEGPAKLQAEMDQELSILRKDAESRGVHWEQLGSIKNAIEAKYSKQAADFREEERVAQEKKDDDAIKAAEAKAEKAAQNELDMQAAQRAARAGALGEDDAAGRDALEIENLLAKNTAKLEAFSQYTTDELAIAQYAADLDVEITRTKEEQKQAIEEERKDAAIKAINDTAFATQELLGKQSKISKAAFLLQKNMLIKETLMNTYASAVKAYNAMAGIPYVGPVLGIVAAAAAVAAGLAQVQQIRSQAMAKGGEVKGSSPHSKSDNIPIMATAKEFMQPVDAVTHYGLPVMNALRKKLIPREVFNGLPIPAYAGSASGSSFAGGGQVPGGGGGGGESKQGGGNIKIMNYIDPEEFISALDSPAGEEAITNVISRNSERVQRVLK